MRLSDLREIDQVTVYKGQQVAGTLTRTVHGCVFEYAQEYLKGNAPGLAFHLPKSQKNYATTGDNLHPFFAGLLPEGLRLTALISAVKTSADDMFSLLAATGRECVGDVFVELPEAHASLPNEHSTHLEDVIFEDLFQESIQSDRYQTRLYDPSIAGVHPKLSAQMISFPVRVAKQTKRYILKLGQAAFPRIIENEHFFMGLARSCGILSARTKIVHDKVGTAGLLVERFDRYYDSATKEMRRIHQEDGCQFTNRYPQDKYRIALRDLGTAIAQFTSAPLLEVGRLIQLLAFSYVIGNGDLHAKNISIVSDQISGRVSLSPAYDLLSTLPYGDDRMALKLEGKDSNLTYQQFLAFGQAFGVPEPALRSTLMKMGKKIFQRIHEIDQIGFDPKKKEYLTRTIIDRMKGLEL